MSVNILSSDQREQVAVGSLFEKMGAIYSHSRITAYRTMTIEDFIRDVVPTLKSGAAADTNFFKYNIKDLSSGRIILVQPDGVEEFFVTEHEEHFEEDFFNTYKSERESSNVSRRDSIRLMDINIDLPVIKYGEDNEVWKAFVKVPSRSIMFRNNRLFRDDRQIRLYLPPLVYGVKFSKTGNFLGSGVAVLVEDSIDLANIKLGKLGLPNIFENGAICVGNTRIEGVSSVTSKAALIGKSFELFMDSNWNVDLVNNRNIPDNATELASNIPEKITGTTAGYSTLIDLLTVLKTKDKWQELKWKEMAGNVFWTSF